MPDPNASPERAAVPGARRARRAEPAATGHERGADSQASSPSAGRPPARPSLPPIPPRPPEEAVASRARETDAHELLAFRRAREGDDGSFATLLRSCTPTLRQVAVALVGPDDADRVLTSAYVKGYRALPVTPDQAPRPWLAHLLLVTCDDDERRRARGRARLDAATGVGPPVPPPIPTALAADHRKVLALVDAAGFTLREATGVLGDDATRLRARLDEARAALRELPAAPSHDTLDGAAAAPWDEPTFWEGLGEALLLAQATPAAGPLPGLSHASDVPLRSGTTRRGASQPSPRIVPAAPRARRDPRRAGALREAQRAQHTPARTPWRRVWVGAVVAIVAVTVLASAAALVRQATRRDAALGLTATKVLDNIDRGLAIDTTLTATVQDRSARDAPSYTYARTSSGSYRLTRSEPLLDEAWDATALRATRVEDAAPGVGPDHPVVVDLTGVSPGAPGVPPVVAEGMGDPLVGAMRLMRNATDATVASEKQDDRSVWVIRGRLGRSQGAEGDDAFPGVGRSAQGQTGDALMLVVDQSSVLPVRFRQERDDAAVRDLRFDDYAIGNPLPANAFTAAVPTTPSPSATVTRGNDGFVTTGIEAARGRVPSLVVTPGAPPPGFVLTNVALRDAPPSEPAPSGTDAATAPLLVLVYRRGAAHFTVTSRAVGSSAAGSVDDGRAHVVATPWKEPLPGSVEIGSGRFARHRARRDPRRPARLWVADDRAGVTITGDLDVDEATRIASSLR